MLKVTMITQDFPYQEGAALLDSEILVLDY
jgi:hypothetical protein